MKKLLVQILAISIAIPSWTAGCYKRVEIPKADLKDQHHFEASGGPYFVESIEQGRSTVPFKGFRVESGTVIGELKDGYKSGQTIYRIEDVKKMERRELDKGRTALATIGVLVGLVVGFGLFLQASIGDKWGK